MSALSKSSRRIAAVASVVVFTVLAGASASWAYWTTQGTAQVTVSSADLTVTTANFSTISKTFGNEALVGTGSVTVTNSTTSASTQKGAVTLVFSATGSTAALRANFGFVVWLSTAANPCTAAATPGTSLASGTWNAGATYTTPGGSGFAVGEARTYCVRTTTAIVPATSWPANGAVSFTPQVVGTIAVGNYSGTASATATQQTAYMFPVSTPNTAAGAYFYIHRVFTTTTPGNYCADLEGGGGPNAIGWPCKTGGTTNQSYRFDAVSGKPGYYTIASNITGGPVLQQNTSGAPVTAVAPGVGQLNQQWTIQTTSTAYGSGTLTRQFYQFVNASSGQCLTYASVEATNVLNQLQMLDCAGGDSQRFLVVRTMFSGVNGATNTVSCAYTVGATPTFTVSLSAATANMRYELRVGATTTAFTANASGVGSVPQLRSALTANSTTNYTIYEDTGAAGDTGTLVASGTFVRGTDTTTANNSCTATGLGQ